MEESVSTRTVWLSTDSRTITRPTGPRRSRRSGPKANRTSRIQRQTTDQRCPGENLGCYPRGPVEIGYDPRARTEPEDGEIAGDTSSRYYRLAPPTKSIPTERGENATNGLRFARSNRPQPSQPSRPPSPAALRFPNGQAKTQAVWGPGWPVRSAVESETCASAIAH